MLILSTCLRFSLLFPVTISCYVEFEASHGTVADLWEMHKAGKETSMNPLGMVEALLGAMAHR